VGQRVAALPGEIFATYLTNSGERPGILRHHVYGIIYEKLAVNIK